MQRRALDFGRATAPEARGVRFCFRVPPVASPWAASGAASASALASAHHRGPALGRPWWRRPLRRPRARRHSIAAHRGAAYSQLSATRGLTIRVGFRPTPLRQRRRLTSVLPLRKRERRPEPTNAQPRTLRCRQQHPWWKNLFIGDWWGSGGACSRACVHAAVCVRACSRVRTCGHGRQGKTPSSRHMVHRQPTEVGASLVLTDDAHTDVANHLWKRLGLGLEANQTGRCRRRCRQGD